MKNVQKVKQDNLELTTALAKALDSKENIHGIILKTVLVLIKMVF